MIQPHEITIGCLLRTNRGEVIRVESISTKRQHRKIGYHPQSDCTHIKYVRMGQVKGIPITEEMLKANGFTVEKYEEGKRWTRVVDIDFQHYAVILHEYSEFGELDHYVVLIAVCFEEDGRYRLLYSLPYVTSVHSLQVAFNICMLHELAEEFKV